MQEYKSAGTSINSSRVPALFKKVLWYPNGTNVDIGGGKFETATEYLAKCGVENLIYDPYNRSESHNKSVILKLAFNRADTATLSNVLNVIKEKDKRREVLERARKWARMTYITVYEGNRSGIGKESKKGCWQENRRLPDYVPEVQEVFVNVEIRNGLIVAWRD